jgi:hypothetical protein
LIDLIGELDAVHLTDEIPDRFEKVVVLLFVRFRTCTEKVFKGIPSFEVETIGVDDFDGLNRLFAVMCRDLLGHAGIIRGKNESCIRGCDFPVMAV